MEATFEENSALSHNDEPKDRFQQYHHEEADDERENLGLGFRTTASFHSDRDRDRDPDHMPTDDEEVQYQQTLSEEFQNLVLEAQELQGGKVMDRENYADCEEGFDDGDGDGGFDDTRKEYDNVGYEEVAEGLNDRKYKRHNNNYPLRPDAEDCQYYMRNGSCKFGSSCKFNHPLRRKNQYSKAVKEKGEYSGRPGQVECKYHLSSEGCKYGNACRYNHSRAKTPANPIVQFNFLGLPIRQGEKECPFYMRNGSCKYGPNCRFNHPDPTAGGDATSGFVNGGNIPLQATTQTPPMPMWSSPTALNGSVPILPVVFSPTNGVPSPDLEWNSYQAPVYPVPEGKLPTPPAFALNNPTETSFCTHHNLPVLLDEFPERPGEPECNYFLKTGDCKYRSGCKFHHPKNRMAKAAPCALSDKGLPLRPGQIACSYYKRYGICKYGPACRYDHSIPYDSTASSTVSGQNGPPYFGDSVVADDGENGWQ